jgi:hypothetical protein
MGIVVEKGTVLFSKYKSIKGIKGDGSIFLLLIEK